MALRLQTGSTELIVSLAQAKEHLGVDHGYDDDRITALIQAAQSLVESEARQDFVSKTWVLDLRDFPRSRCNMIELPRPPLRSVDSVKYYSSGTLTTVPSSDYYTVRPYQQPGLIEPVTSWPACDDRPDAVQITFTTGSTGTTPPAAIHAVKMLAAAWNENREAEVVGTISSQLQIGLDRLLNQLWVGGYY